jgi:hypothetical protein
LRDFPAEACFVERHQAVAIGIGEGLEQHRVDDGEDGAVGSDAEREGQYNGSEEGWPAKKAAISSHVGYDDICTPNVRRFSRNMEIGTCNWRSSYEKT